MDRIRRALDLAREERASAMNAEPAAYENVERLPANRMPREISYTITRIFSPDAKALESQRIIDPAGRDPAASAFRMLRTQVVQRMDDHGWRSLAVLSPSPDDGKTTTALNLATNLANDLRHTVLLVDFDLRQPSIAQRLGLNPEFGVDDVLAGRAQLDQCLYHPTGFDRLVVLPARSNVAESSTALTCPTARTLVSELRSRYPDRIIIFDLPPVLSADDALAFLPQVECALMVVAERGTKRDDLLRTMELTRKTPIIGTVINRASGTTSGYG